MQRASRIQSGTYRDSVSLMQLSEKLSQREGIERAFVAMGTAANKRVLEEVGMLTEELRGAGSNDLMMVAESDSHQQAEEALGAAVDQLRSSAANPSSSPQGSDDKPTTLRGAAAKLPEANLLLLSVPGPFAALEAAKALHLGLHVFLFSDNVSLREELELKRLAVSRGLLLMGPGCGTAIINGVALAFANVVRRGSVGIVGASGTGLQEVTTLIDRGGGGISQAIGVGGRDLSREIGGLMMLQGIEMLGADPATEVIVLISKPPEPTVAQAVLKAAVATGKKVIVNFLGESQTGRTGGALLTDTLEDTATAALAEVVEGAIAPLSPPTEDLEATAEEQRLLLAPGQRFIRGLFSGGSLCDEAMEILARKLSAVHSNIPLDPSWALEDIGQSHEHSCLDMGEEDFTQGRPHPMIDLRWRARRLLQEAADPQVAVILLDVVLGHGSSEDPAGGLEAAIAQGRQQARNEGRHLVVIAHVCGTERDPQDLEDQEARLRQAGALTLSTNAGASRLALSIVSGDSHANL
ncbi:MAG: acyl-CoA synthetase FdrA [Deltaproteobacteria bacterium]|nr:acyl-CoA synthetase FdrA [Deltaproteobacteria bacterium]